MKLLHFIRFSKDIWTPDKAIGNYLKPNKNHYKKMSDGDDYFEFMQTPKSKIDKNGLTNIILEVKPHGVVYVYYTDEIIESTAAEVPCDFSMGDVYDI